MKLQIVYDEQGRILAAVQIGSGWDEVTPERGEHVGEFEVPSQFADTEFPEIVRRLRVDPKANCLTESAAE
jgi:hypothetical protein